MLLTRALAALQLAHRRSKVSELPIFSILATIGGIRPALLSFTRLVGAAAPPASTNLRFGDPPPAARELASVKAAGNRLDITPSDPESTPPLH